MNGIMITPIPEKVFGATVTDVRLAKLDDATVFYQPAITEPDG